jgi:hypothetical protein
LAVEEVVADPSPYVFYGEEKERELRTRTISEGDL